MFYLNCIKVLYEIPLLFSTYFPFNLCTELFQRSSTYKSFLTLTSPLEYTGIIYPRKGGRSGVDYYGAYPLNSNINQGYRPLFSKAQYLAPPCQQILPLSPPLKLDYWQLLAPALVGTAGALFLSLFADCNNFVERCGESIFKLALVTYALGGTVAASFAVAEVLKNSNDPQARLLYPIEGALVSVILLFAAEFLLLYRFVPDSFKGEIGDNFWTQFFSFLYLSVTSIATADLGDILPGNLTARALIAIEIAFNLFTLATGIQLLLAQN